MSFGSATTIPWQGLVANLVEAELLVVLTDQEGLYTADPRIDPDARFIPKVARPGIPSCWPWRGRAAATAAAACAPS